MGKKIVATLVAAVMALGILPGVMVGAAPTLRLT